MPSLRSRLSLEVLGLVVVIVVLPAIGLFVAGTALAATSLRRVVDEQLARSLDGTEKRFSEALYDLLELSARMVDDREIRRVLAQKGDEVERTRALDRAVSALLLFFRYREDIRFTIIDPRGRLFTNWSRNLEDYSFLQDLPLSRRARAELGHAVWEGFAPAYVREEGRAGLHYITVARTFPDFEAEAGSQPLLLLSISSDAVGSILTEGGGGPGALALLANASGAVLAMGGPGLPLGGQGPALGAKLAAGGGGYLRIGSRTYLASSRVIRRLPQELKDYAWRIVAADEYGTLSRGLSGVPRLLLAALGLLFLAALVLTLLFSRQVVKPVIDLARRMDGWTLGGEALLPPSARTDEIGVLERSFADMGQKIRELFDSIRREHEIREDYRRRALRSRLNPHFLFNSLNTVRFMAIISKADNIVEAIDAVSTMLQYAMSKEGDFTSLGEELRNLESYLFIQNARFGGRFTLSRDVGEDLLGASIPRFILQPSVENSVIHGYEDAFGSGEIRVSARLAPPLLTISVEDGGRGIPASRLAGIFEVTAAAGAGQGQREEGGLGLPLVREMVRATCGEGYDVTIESREGGGTRVNYILPWSERGCQ